MYADIFLLCFPEQPLYISEKNKYQCIQCGRHYKHKAGWYQHKRYECGKEAQFHCHLCPHKAKHKHNLKSHIVFKHNIMDVENVLK